MVGGTGCFPTMTNFIDLLEGRPQVGEIKGVMIALSGDLNKFLQALPGPASPFHL